jgi:hypothetical protein
LNGQQWINAVAVETRTQFKTSFTWKEQKLLWATYLYWALIALNFFVLWFFYAVYLGLEGANELTARLIEALGYLCSDIKQFLTVLIALMSPYYFLRKKYAVALQYFFHFVVILVFTLLVWPINFDLILLPFFY